jgi:hypothetical protein
VSLHLTDQWLIKFSAFIRYWRRKWEYNEAVHLQGPGKPWGAEIKWGTSVDAYVDVNLLGDKIDCKEKCSNSNAGKKAGPQIKAEKTKYMLLSSQVCLVT